MIDRKTETRIFHFVLLSFAAFVILATACSPLAIYEQPATTTAEPTITILSINPSVIPPPTPQSVCTVTTGYQVGRVNLRSQPTTSARVLRVVIEAEILKVIERGAWLQVIDAKGNQGFIYSKYCKE